MTFPQEELESAENSPEYKRVLKILIKYQMHTLCQKLADIGEESCVLTASVSDATVGHVGSSKGEGFLENTSDLEWKFLSFCNSEDAVDSTGGNMVRTVSAKDSQIRTPQIVQIKCEPEDDFHMKIVDEVNENYTSVYGYELNDHCTEKGMPRKIVAELSTQMETVQSCGSERYRSWKIGKGPDRNRSRPYGNSKLTLTQREIRNQSQTEQSSKTVDLTLPHETVYEQNGIFQISRCKENENLHRSSSERQIYEEHGSGLLSEERRSLDDVRDTSGQGDGNTQSLSLQMDIAGNSSVDSSDVTQGESSGENIDLISSDHGENEHHGNVKSGSDHFQHSKPLLQPSSSSLLNEEQESHTTYTISSKKRKRYSNIGYGQEMFVTAPKVNRSAEIFQNDEIYENECLEDFNIQHEKYMEEFNIGSDSQNTYGAEEQSIHQCALCLASFADADSFEMHIQDHNSGLIAMSCFLCEKEFPTRRELTYHMRTHKDQKAYVCTVCGKSFGILWNLKVHMRQHTDAKPYTCPLCEKPFKHSNSLNRHMKVHAKRVQVLSQ